MRPIIKYFLENPIVGNTLMFFLFLMGFFGLLNLKSTLLPEQEDRFINIQTVYLGASPEEMEEGVVSKIEENLKGITNIERVTSVSSENSGQVTVEITKDAEIDVVLQDVKNAVDQINSFPVAMEPPTIFKVENLNLALTFALSGDVDLKTLKRFARKAEEEILAIDGISKVALSGFPEEEIEIAFREADLRAYQLTFAEATRAVQFANLELTGGKIRGTQEELQVRARNKGYYAADLRDIVVKTSPDGSIVYLHQIADLRDDWNEDNPNRSYMNGEPAVVITLQSTIAEDLLSVVEKTKIYFFIDGIA